MQEMSLPDERTITLVRMTAQWSFGVQNMFTYFTASNQMHSLYCVVMNDELGSMCMEKVMAYLWHLPTLTTEG